MEVQTSKDYENEIIDITYTVSHNLSGWPDWAKFCHLGDFLWRWANFFLEKIAQWFGWNFSNEKIDLNKAKILFQKRCFTCFSKIFKKIYLLYYVKKTIKECSVPLDISIKSHRKHHKTVLYSKSNKNMVGRFFVVFGQFFNKNIYKTFFVRNLRIFIIS